MRKSLWLALLPLFIIGIYIFYYNTLVSTEVAVDESFAQIQSNLQRKLDLLPNLVRVVKSYATHEKETFERIAALRTQQVDTPTKEMSTKELQKMLNLNKSLNASTLKLFAVAEQYPQLRSSEQFLQLQAQIEGSDNRINVTRMLYNSSVKTYNTKLKVFPSNIVAKIHGFEKREYFNAEKKANKTLVLDL